MGLIVLLSNVALVAILSGISKPLENRRVNRELIENDCLVSYRIGDGNINTGLGISEDGKLLAALDGSKLMIIESQNGNIIIQTDLDPRRRQTVISRDAKNE